MKQLNWWRGLWRVWIIGTVAWAVWMFWKSKRLATGLDVRLASADRHTYTCITLGYRWLLRTHGAKLR
jgi:hypothetical protein